MRLIMAAAVGPTLAGLVLGLVNALRGLPLVAALFVGPLFGIAIAIPLSILQVGIALLLSVGMRNGSALIMWFAGLAFFLDLTFLHIINRAATVGLGGPFFPGAYAILMTSAAVGGSLLMISWDR